MEVEQYLTGTVNEEVVDRIAHLLKNGGRSSEVESMRNLLIEAREEVEEQLLELACAANVKSPGMYIHSSLIPQSSVPTWQQFFSVKRRAEAVYPPDSHDPSLCALFKEIQSIFEDLQERHAFEVVLPPSIKEQAFVLRDQVTAKDRLDTAAASRKDRIHNQDPDLKIYRVKRDFDKKSCGLHRTRFIKESFQLTLNCRTPPSFRSVPAPPHNKGESGYPTWARRYSIALQVVDLHWLWQIHKSHLRPSSSSKLMCNFVEANTFSLKLALKIARARMPIASKTEQLGVSFELQLELAILRTSNARKFNQRLETTWLQIQHDVLKDAEIRDYEVVFRCLRIAGGKPSNAAKLYTLATGKVLDRRRMFDRRVSIEQRVKRTINW